MIMSIFMSLIGLIPGLTSLFAAIAKARYDAQVAIIQARTGADAETAGKLVYAAAVEAHEATARLSVIAGSTILLLIVAGFATPLIIFEWKVIVWDKVLGWGSTDPLTGLVADWANTIIAGVFGAPTALALGHMYYNRKQ